MLRAIPGLRDIALSTNGHLLAELAGPLRAAGVDRLNISLDTLDPERFAAITRRGDWPACWPASRRRAPPASPRSRSTPSPSRASTTTRSAPCATTPGRRRLVPRFIEQMPMAGGALFVPGTLLSAAEIRRPDRGRLPRRPAWCPYPRPAAGPGRRPRPLLVARGRRRGERQRRTVTAWWASSRPMTEHFCDTCNRVRLSSAGRPAHLPGLRRRRRPARGPAQRGPRGGHRRAIRQALGRKTRRPQLPAHRPRRPPQGDDPDRRLRPRGGPQSNGRAAAKNRQSVRAVAHRKRTR